jgi:hypothetical protein
VLVKPADQTIVMDRGPYDDTTAVFTAPGADPTAVFAPTPAEDTGDAGDGPPPPGPVVAPPAWSELPPTPVVSSVQGVEVDPDVGRRRRDVPSTPAPRAPDGER